jgi:hypothetical protein
LQLIASWISDRDQLAEAVYTAAVETGALVGAV